MVTLEGKIAAVMAKWPDVLMRHHRVTWQSVIVKSKESKVVIGQGNCDETVWDSAFSPLTPADRALAVECPVCEEGGFGPVDFGKIGHPCGMSKNSPTTKPGDVHPERIAAVEREEKSGIQIRSVNAEQAVVGLKEIFSQLQNTHHDQWDWMNAEFYLEVLRCAIEDKAEPAEQDDLGIEDLLVDHDEIGQRSGEDINHRLREADRRGFERGKKAGM